MEEEGGGGGAFWPSANKRIGEYATVNPCLIYRAVCYPYGRE